MILVPSAVPRSVPDLRRVVAAPHGTVTVHALAAGERLEVLAAGEEAHVVLVGCARWGRALLLPGEGVHQQPGSRAVFTAEGGPLILFAASAAVRAVGAVGAVGAAPGPPRRLAAGDGDRTLARTGGFDGMGVRWLATTQSVGARRLTVATSAFTPGGRHELHRHPAAGEFFLVLTGGGEHLTERGPVRLAAGDLAYVPAGEWHGYRTDPDRTTTALYGYLGAGSLTAAGYQVKPAVRAEAS
ncbi:cupin domain-containing protein [Kitasatospora cinereorecta]|uniref:Cupin domain-containing protein n=1 Tax=Kitasatospora cinereorecta TaxID=285560 RepID=A0ABW0VB02_9ACTN